MDDRLAVAVITLDYLFILAISWFAVSAQSKIVDGFAIALIAGRQMAFLNLVHAAAHFTLFSHRRANDLSDVLFGYWILEPLRPYRAVHLRHHRAISLQHPDRFDYLFRHLPPADAGAWKRTWAVIGKPLCGWTGAFFIRTTARVAVDNPAIGVRLAAFWALISTLCWYAGWLQPLVLYWVVPLLWLYPAFVFWAELSDHYAVARDARNQRGVFYSLFLKGHEMYHAVHHRHPRIPFYRVRSASAYLQSIGESSEESRGIADFIRIVYSCTDAAAMRGEVTGSVPIETSDAQGASPSRAGGVEQSV